MAIKYFCDVCEDEIKIGERVILMGAKTNFSALCRTCWNKAEEVLTQLKNKHKR